MNANKIEDYPAAPAPKISNQLGLHERAMAELAQAVEEPWAPRFSAPRIGVRLPRVDRFRIHSLKDISESGAFIASDIALPIGYELLVELCGEGEPLLLRARIARKAMGEDEKMGVGIAFVRNSPEAARRLREVIERYGEAPVANDDDGSEG